MNTDPNPTLERLDQALTELQAGRLDTRQFVALARDQPELLARLPPRYAEVLNGLLDRLEELKLALLQGEAGEEALERLTEPFYRADEARTPGD